MLDIEALGLLAREVLRERAAELIAETCAWSVGLSDTPHRDVRDGRLVATGVSLGVRAEAAQPLSAAGAGRFALADAVPGSFRDALNALTEDGRVHADRFDDDVLTPWVLRTAVAAAERVRDESPADWAELLDEVGEDESDLPVVVRALEWDATLKTEAEQLVLAALGDVPLVEVEAEGAPLALVRAAEHETRSAVPAEAAEPAEPDPGALFLAETAVSRTGLRVPVRPDDAVPLLDALSAEGLEPDEVRQLLPHLPVLADTADRVETLLDEP